MVTQRLSTYLPRFPAVFCLVDKFFPSDLIKSYLLCYATYFPITASCIVKNGGRRRLIRRGCLKEGKEKGN